MSKISIRKNDKRLRALVADLTETLLGGKKYQVSSFGTFSTCSRKATADREACKMAMFRASAELREFASGGPKPMVTGPHADIIQIIMQGMLSEQGIDVPLLGRMAVVPSPGKTPKLIFHALDELNEKF